MTNNKLGNTVFTLTELSKEEIRAELKEWTIYSVCDGNMEIESAFDSTMNHMIEMEELDGFTLIIDKDEYFTTEFIKECFVEIEKFFEDTDYSYQYEKPFKRKCSVCDYGMNDGYYNEDAVEYYCSNKCLNKALTLEEIEELQENEENMKLYYTEWED